MTIRSYLLVKGGKRKKKMKALERTNFHVTLTINICNEPVNLMTCGNYNNLVKILI